MLAFKFEGGEFENKHLKHYLIDKDLYVPYDLAYTVSQGNPPVQAMFYGRDPGTGKPIYNYTWDFSQSEADPLTIKIKVYPDRVEDDPNDPNDGQDFIVKNYDVETWTVSVLGVADLLPEFSAELSFG